MEINMEQLRHDLEQLLHDLKLAKPFTEKTLLVIGCSTSEVLGERIGTSGSQDVAAVIFSTLQKEKIQLAFQCCEHLNRALVVERELAEEKGYEPVSAIPIRKAGGAMATYAFSQMKNPVLVEDIQADCGLDIGDTFIGMHLKKVVVPIRSEIKVLGSAHVTMAITRPKLIGGVRTVYEQTVEHE
ncbi:TIGR01440 family protein [Alkalihalobacillus pseudalcaliphilus]|uniref:TIGR01440 family protein n=1 Tax=Alkalihalobacillus pseudalcaliphilus TaxID=79884 RepID=UPI00064DEF08|nr:TIGR01440 family protein [Alkalihalobacillus pseudalcaliphilus]KMK78269.1 hypothetical protein AB990_02205 [Alkalihalobacillus pseudalcaliphilus]